MGCYDVKAGHQEATSQSIATRSHQVIEDERIHRQADKQNPPQQHAFRDSTAQQVRRCYVQKSAEQRAAPHRQVRRSKYGDKELHHQRVENVIIRSARPVRSPLWSYPQFRGSGFVDRNGLYMRANKNQQDNSQRSDKQRNLSHRPYTITTVAQYSFPSPVW